MALLKFARSLFAILAIQTVSAQFTYQGLHEWTDISPTCAGRCQSPIDIDTEDVIHVEHKFHGPTFVNYDQHPIRMYMKNDGHSVQIYGEWADGEVPMIISDGMHKSEPYIFQQLHFHWGQDCLVGSEHTFDGKSRKAEAHVVHMNAKYKNMEEARQHKDGIIVVAHTYEIDQFDSLEPLSKNLRTVSDPNDTLKFSHPFSLNDLEMELDGRYIRYQGSLTTPPCSEAVTWYINPHSKGITKETLEAFRCIDLAGGDKQNVRPTQPLNNRKVFLVHCN